MSEPPGSYNICPICWWQDDWIQTLDPTSAGGANSVSLIEAQANFQQFDTKVPGHGRAPGPNDRRESGWRPINKELDLIGLDDEATYGVPTPPELLELGEGSPKRLFGAISNPEEAADPERLYWWRPTYWRRNKSAS